MIQDSKSKLFDTLKGTIQEVMDLSDMMTDERSKAGLKAAATNMAIANYLIINGGRVEANYDRFEELCTAFMDEIDAAVGLTE